MSQIIDDLARILSRILPVHRQDVKSGKAEVVRGTVTVTALQHFTVKVPLDAHVGVGVRLNSALVVCALSLHKLRGPIQLSDEAWSLVYSNLDIFLACIPRRVFQLLNFVKRCLVL